MAQKRKLLSTLREELEYSREKWQEAREKNSKTEKQWRQLRGEFAARRTTVSSDDFNNSQESGYSDERCSSSDDEPGYETDVSEYAPQAAVDDDVVCDDQASENQITPVPTIDQAAVDYELQSRVSRTERSIERSNNVIESKLQTGSSDIVKDLSTELVSSVIEEAIASILKSSNSSEEKTESSVPSTSTSSEPQTKTLEELLAAKEARLKRLEGQCGQLMEQVTSTTQKSIIISNKLDDLHEVYGDRSEVQTSERTSSDTVEETLEINEDDQE